MKHGTHTSAKKCKCDICVDFLREYMRQYRADNAERLRGYYKKNGERYRERSRYRWANDEEFRQRKLDTRRRCWYGLEAGEYVDLLAAQGGVCAICRTPEPGGVGSWKIDHDHACCPGKKSCGDCVRGLLCNNCNHALGHLKDSVGSLERAIDYLKTPPLVTLRKLV